MLNDELQDIQIKGRTAEDVAKAVIYLSDNNVASFMTGTEILMDGGMVL